MGSALDFRFSDHQIKPQLEVNFLLLCKPLIPTFPWIEFSLNGDAFCIILQNREKTKTKSSSKMWPPVGIEPRASDFNALHATAWANSLFAGSLRPLDLYIVMLLILGRRDFFGINLMELTPPLPPSWLWHLEVWELKCLNSNPTAVSYVCLRKQVGRGSVGHARWQDVVMCCTQHAKRRRPISPQYKTEISVAPQWICFKKF